MRKRKKGLLMRPRVPSGFSNFMRMKEMLVGAVGIENDHPPC